VIPRMVIRVASELSDIGAEQLVLSLEEPAADGVTIVQCRGTEPELQELAADPLHAGAVLASGRFLFDKLTAHHPIEHELKYAVTKDGPPRQLYLELRAQGAAEAIPWETLCSPGNYFLSLDPRWPVTRLVRPVDMGAGVRSFQPPLRVALLLSCLGIPAAPEWRQIWSVLASAPFPVEVLALVSEDQLKQEITAIDDPRITVEGVPPQIAPLQQRISQFRPHVIHAFCHGSLEEGAHLELAVASDWVAGRPLRSLVLEPSQLNELSNPAEATWLAVLNCCNVGAPVGAVHSLARDLVQLGPFAAAIAMREPVRPADAFSFSAGLYPGLVTAVQRVVAAAGAATDFDWASMMVEPRRRLCQDQQGPSPFSAKARSTKQWTLPVLYVRSTAFQANLDNRPTTDSDALTLELLRTLRSQLSPDVPASLRADIDARIAQLEARVP
jgi:hypothetical protein